MPKNPKAMVHRTLAEEKELILQSEIFQLQQAERATRPRRNTRLQEITEEIYQIFDNNATLTAKLMPIRASEFDYLRSKYSPPTIVKARKILGITSIRRNGLWWWKYPKASPSEALASAHNVKIKELNAVEEELKKIHRAAAVTLQGIMLDHRLYVENVVAFAEMEFAKYSRNTTLRMKNDLHIVSKKVDGKWMWIWAHRDVQDWLLDKLKDGPRPYTSLFIEAKAEYGWHEEVLKLARLALGTVWPCIVNNTGCWRDMGIITPDLPATPIVAAPSVPGNKDIHRDVVSREIVVDFEEEEDELY